MAESSTFVGTHYILGSWYKPGELGKRSAIFTSSGLAGTLLTCTSKVFRRLASSSLQKFEWSCGQERLAMAVSTSPTVVRVRRTNQNDTRDPDVPAHRFIIDGIITLPIAFYGFLIFPDVPATTKAFYLSEEVIARLPFPSFEFWIENADFAISGETESFGSNNLMGQWLKAVGGYTVEQIDYYPSGVTAFGIASTLVCATWTDRTQRRWPVLVYMSVACAVAAVCILVWGSPTGLKFFAYCASGFPPHP
ncbi:hypothetical protein EW146_g4092 [Bondarzewia mesenterica]|uniref:Major facilitator superfamily (MFS) profile domain-containing protein n=1 Tax=Bondarzewia mesenterica TaxID=1095465 RepID=A0A4S4M1D0_9AGAM|nr:hypothetical protein EW146_g4092 [Bondarzewia mesenterica]